MRIAFARSAFSRARLQKAFSATTPPYSKGLIGLRIMHYAVCIKGPQTTIRKLIASLASAGPFWQPRRQPCKHCAASARRREFFAFTTSSLRKVSGNAARSAADPISPRGGAKLWIRRGLLESLVTVRCDQELIVSRRLVPRPSRAGRDRSRRLCRPANKVRSRLHAVLIPKRLPSVPIRHKPARDNSAPPPACAASRASPPALVALQGTRPAPVRSHPSGPMLARATTPLVHEIV